MNNVLRLPLQTSAAQAQRLAALQAAFADACNALAPVAHRHRCWNRVALHHLAYKDLRERFPQLGSQMACNAIYSVCRACRWVYQHPSSPHNVQRRAGAPLPRLRFSAHAPVFFDRHTLSIRRGQVSLFTLDGRMRFELGLGEADEARFRTQRLREIVLSREAGRFWLSFTFAPTGDAAAGDDAGQWPEYVVVAPDADATSDAATRPQPA